MLPKFLDTGDEAKSKRRAFGFCRQELNAVADAGVVLRERCTTSRNASQVAALLEIIFEDEISVCRRFEYVAG
jgi:hypothetical protein